MDRSYLDHSLTEDERNAFETDGFFVVQDAMSPDTVARMKQAVGASNHIEIACLVCHCG